MGEAKRRGEYEKQHADAVRRTVQEMTKIAADSGLVIELGWLGVRAQLQPGLDIGALDQLRQIYFAGCQHVFSSLMAVMDDDREPTEQDLSRVSKIAEELETWRIQMEMRMKQKLSVQ